MSKKYYATSNPETYLTNPSINEVSFESRNRRVFVKNNQAVIITDTQTGEQVTGNSMATFVKPDIVDTEKFIKIYTAGIDELMNLSASGLKLFKLIYMMMRENKDTDVFTLDYTTLKAYGKWKWSQPTFNNGLNELLNHKVLFKSIAPAQYFINVKFFFNGNRINIVQSYKLKEDDLFDEDAFLN